MIRSRLRFTFLIISIGFTSQVAGQLQYDTVLRRISLSASNDCDSDVPDIINLSLGRFASSLTRSFTADPPQCLGEATATTAQDTTVALSNDLVFGTGDASAFATAEGTATALSLVDMISPPKLDPH
ncbi:MAG: hypothetical protein AAGF33_18760 [Pseudomonadota bacterium]